MTPDAVWVKETIFEGKDLMRLANNPDGPGSVKLESIVDEVSKKATGTLFITTKPTMPERGTATDKKIDVATPRFEELIKGPVALKLAINPNGEIQNATAIPDKKNEKFLALLSKSPLASALSSAGMTVEDEDE